MKSIYFLRTCIFLLMFLVSFGSVYAQEADDQSNISGVNKTSVAPPPVFFEKIPPFISKPLTKVYFALENFRVDVHTTTHEKKEALQNQMKEDEIAREKIRLEKEKADVDTFDKTRYIDSSPGNVLDRAWWAIQIFFHSTILFLLGSVLVFYIALGLIISMFIRVLWRFVL